MSQNATDAYERLREATAKVDVAWARRITVPDQLKDALDEMNDAGLALVRALGGTTEEIS